MLHLVSFVSIPACMRRLWLNTRNYLQSASVTLQPSRIFKWNRFFHFISQFPFIKHSFLDSHILMGLVLRNFHTFSVEQAISGSPYVSIRQLRTLFLCHPIILSRWWILGDDTVSLHTFNPRHVAQVSSMMCKCWRGSGRRLIAYSIIGQFILKTLAWIFLH